MPIGTASARLRKAIMFKLIQSAHEDICYRCHRKIEDARDLTIEHKVPWLDSYDPLGLFFDLDNIAFSHLVCNARAGRKVPRQKGKIKHGTHAAYTFHKCRCEECRRVNRIYMRKYRQKTLSRGEIAKSGKADDC